MGGARALPRGGRGRGVVAHVTTHNKPGQILILVQRCQNRHREKKEIHLHVNVHVQCTLYMYVCVYPSIIQIYIVSYTEVYMYSVCIHMYLNRVHYISDHTENVETR